MFAIIKELDIQIKAFLTRHGLIVSSMNSGTNLSEIPRLFGLSMKGVFSFKGVENHHGKSNIPQKEFLCFIMNEDCKRTINCCSLSQGIPSYLEHGQGHSWTDERFFYDPIA
ncbi:hypothetical protein RF11_14513 [Thelohanellus kitauei]|uniref:Uncharacterized protein n=1 Tax=Thelohanellus kitauei TaxID=669202 RepID=A0A0C2MHB7_THEKT|nr:hypothetical protein RF11_14513 [Thelohanellus kitauei]